MRPEHCPPGALHSCDPQYSDVPQPLASVGETPHLGPRIHTETGSAGERPPSRAKVGEGLSYASVHILPAFGCSAFVVGCGLAEVFGSPKIGNVVVTYTGPTTVSVIDMIPFAVSVTVDGAAVPNPRLFINSLYPSIIALSSTSDTLIALSRGFDTLKIQFAASIFTDSFPTILQPIKVIP